jgi:4a-hydroxytetrahydrobiopterin dehydratase
MIPEKWINNQDKLYRKFVFTDFSEAFGFISRVSLIAEKINHHPTWSNTWNTVEIWLSTHDAGNIITDKDLLLATEIDKLIS